MSKRIRRGLHQGSLLRGMEEEAPVKGVHRLVLAVWHENSEDWVPLLMMDSIPAVKCCADCECPRELKAALPNTEEKLSEVLDLLKTLASACAGALNSYQQEEKPDARTVEKLRAELAEIESRLKSNLIDRMKN